jgi:hypothetical protein
MHFEKLNSVLIFRTWIQIVFHQKYVITEYICNQSTWNINLSTLFDHQIELNSIESQPYNFSTIPTARLSI